MIEIKDLHKTFDIPVLNGISTTINDGEIIAILGGSGCGKSTFIRCINLLNEPDSGQVILDGEVISDKNYDKTRIARKIGMVFQSFNLFDNYNVLENIMMPQIDILHKSKQEAYDTAVSLLKMVNLSNRGSSYPEELSGGQKQRVAIARTLAMDPEVLLFDEPTSALDPTMVGEVEAVIKQLTKTGKTMMIVTHDMEFARSIATRVFFMCDGIIYEEGTPEEIFEKPKKEKTKQFIHQMKVLEYHIDDGKFDFYNAFAEIEKYCQKNLIVHEKAYHLQSILYEICREILFPYLDEIDIHCEIEYDPKNDNLFAVFNYGKDRYDIRDSENRLSLSIIEGCSKSIRYKENANDKYYNTVSIRVK